MSHRPPIRKEDKTIEPKCLRIIQLRDLNARLPVLFLKELKYHRVAVHATMKSRLHMNIARFQKSDTKLSKN